MNEELHTVRKAVAGEIGARVLANVAYGAARSGRGESAGVLLTALGRAAERLVSEFNDQELAISAWALATVDESDGRLLTALARAT